MRFLLNTDTVSEVATAINKTSQEVQSIMDSCNKYSVDNSDGFDFAGAKSVIVSNLSNCAARMNATAGIINSVVTEHSGLQSSITFEKYLNPEKDKKSSDKTSSSGGSSGGSRRRSGGSRRSSGGSSSGVAAAVETGIIIEEEQEKKVPEIKKVGYAVIDEKGLTTESKKLLKKSSNVNNIIKMGNRYVIACDPAYAKVGDVIRYTGKDGKVVECVVGINTVTKANKNSVYFLADNNKFTALPAAGIITGADTKVENLGNYTKVPDKEIMDGLRGPVESIGTQTPVEGQTGTTTPSTETQVPVEGQTGTTTPSTETQVPVEGQTGAIPSSTETQVPETSQVSTDTTTNNTETTNSTDNNVDLGVQEGGSVNA